MTSKEFAHLLGVSQSTVSRALNNSPLISESRKAFIRLKAAEFGFELNSQARSLKTNRTGTVGILFPRHFKSMNDNLMLTHLYDRIQKELIASDHDIMTVYDYGENRGISAFERIIKRRKVDALIILRSELSEREMDLIRENNFPCVSMLLTGSQKKPLYYCLSDSRLGGELAGDFFGGFPEFAMMYIGIDEDPDESRNRCAGFRRGLAKHGRKLPAANVFSCGMSFASAYELAGKMLPGLGENKTAVFAYNDIVALGIIDAIREKGIAIPGRVQLIGMDDIPLAGWMRPHLSTLHIPVEDMVPNACKLIRDLIEGNDMGDYRSMYQPTLITRDTTLSRPSARG
ncbi:MAG: LacI family transcriptional regulator [Planctomycetota bacterium]|jgi:DNA-binding LacI/PurR family transcriptional regulator|nr:LacI family transcriptional regulator [Planctomycetota bacterium]